MFMRVMLKGEQKRKFNRRLGHIRLETAHHEYVLDDVVKNYERKMEDVKALHERKMEGVKASCERKLAEEVACVTTAHDELMQWLASVTTSYGEKKSEAQHLHAEMYALGDVHEEKIAAELAKYATAYT